MQIQFLDIDQIAASGQTFRWYKVSQGYVVVHKDQGLHVTQNKHQIKMNLLTQGTLEDWYDYLDLNRDYKSIRQSLYGKNPYLDEAMTYGEGIRVLNQDAYEMLVTFMISANNNMKRIKESVRLLSLRYGKKIFEFENQPYYSFPTKEALKDVSVKELRACGLGYRDKYVFELIEALNQGLNISKFHEFTDDDLRKALMAIKGVGEKVANCVILFGYQRRNGFPIDTWIKKVLFKHFDVEEKGLQKYVENFFPYEGGLAQQYLFYYGGVAKK